MIVWDSMKKNAKTVLRQCRDSMHAWQRQWTRYEDSVQTVWRMKKQCEDSVSFVSKVMHTSCSGISLIYISNSRVNHAWSLTNAIEKIDHAWIIDREYMIHLTWQGTFLNTTSFACFALSVTKLNTTGNVCSCISFLCASLILQMTCCLSEI